MFERLAGKVLGNLLSKYFTEESLAKNKVSTSTQLGVWSGYVSLKNLELKKDYINSKLRRKGKPFEIVHCSFRQVEITIPWAKLSNPITSSSAGNKEDGVVVVVLDGIHLLARTYFDFDDVALREEEIDKRRKALLEAGFLANDDSENQSTSYTEMLKNRVKEGLIQEIAGRLHVHLRDLHIRLEDVESDPQNPYSCGITMESMHIQHNDEGEDIEGVVSKVAQLNHFAVYWNALDYGNGLPVENSVLHQTCHDDPERLARSLNFCIARRASIIATPSRNPYIPTHSYILMPVDGTWHGNLSLHPDDLSQNPAVEIVVSIEPVRAQIRDFQCVQILRLASEYKNHSFVMKHRRFRPLVSVKEDPKSWWLYAARVIRYQLREGFLRWSWSQFIEVYTVRGRYMELYERRVRHPSSRQKKTLERLSSGVVDGPDLWNRSRRSSLVLNSDMLDQENGNDDSCTAPDEGAGPSTPPTPDNGPLNEEELLELQDMEDGILGDLSIPTILLFRSIVHMRRGLTMSDVQQGNGKRSSWWAPTVESVVIEDSEARAEFEKLLNYTERGSDNQTLQTNNSLAAEQTAVSVMVRLEEVSVAFMSPLEATASETPLRRIYKKYLELSVIDVQHGFSLKGDYESKEFQLTVLDLVGTEIRQDRSEHIVTQQIAKDDTPPGEDEPKPPLAMLILAKNAENTTTCDVELVVLVNAIEVSMSPECEWISQTQEMFSRIRKIPNVADYWDHMSLAYMNSLSLGRLGFFAKAESAAYEHKSMEVDISVQCPVLKIGSTSGDHIIFDLGTAKVKTEKLAGISRAKSHTAQLLEIKHTASSFDQFSGRLDDASVVGTLSNRPWQGKTQLETPTGSGRRMDRSVFASSAVSVGSKNILAIGNRSITGTVFFDDSFGRLDSVEDRKAKEAENLNSIFYDVYLVHLQSGKMTFCGDEGQFDISTGFEISTTVKKSVLPADHTLCKLKSHTVVSHMNFSFNEGVIRHFGNMLSTWKEILGRNDTPRTPQRHRHLSDLHRTPMASSSAGSASVADSEDGSLSQIDESEFFDANESTASMAGDNSAVWFDDNWISDAESFIEGDGRSLQNDRRSRRRRAASISDVSSASDQSTKESSKGLKSPQGNAYLSAENLARLEEGDDESLAESDIEVDDASFHSVMSASGQEAVLHELEDDIKKADELVERLHEKLHMAGQNNDSGTQVDQEARRLKMKSARLELDRAKVELNALQALHDDLSLMISEIPLNTEGNADELALRNQQAQSAKALLAAKKLRDSVLETNGTHNLTSNLNRELLQGSLVVHQIQITLHLETSHSEDEAPAHGGSSFNFVASQSGLAFFKSANETKLYFSTDQVTASFITPNLPQPSLLLSGESTDTLLPSHFPHLISRSMEDKFIRGSLHLGKRRAIDPSSRYTKTTKVRLVLGDVEVSPSIHILSPLKRALAVIKVASGPKGDKGDGKDCQESLAGGQTLGQKAEERVDSSSRTLSEPFSKYNDIAIRLTSVRVVLSYNNQVVGAIAVTESALRSVEVSSLSRHRLQVDIRCTNLQMLEISNLEAGRGSEIAGRRDPYNAILQVRLRSQLVPGNESGGWVIGLENRAPENQLSTDSDVVRNVHVGVKFNPVSFVASNEAIASLIASTDELKGAFTKPKNIHVSNETIASQKTNQTSLLQRLEKRARLRWRIDVSLKRVAVTFPEDKSDEWYLTDDVSSKMAVAFSVVACLQESTVNSGSLSLELGLTDVTLVRSSDDYPILEPFSLLCDLCVEHKLLERTLDASDRSLIAGLQLHLDAESPLNEISAVMQRYGWESLPSNQTLGRQLGLAARVTPLRANVTAPVLDLLFGVARSLKRALTKERSLAVSPRKGTIQGKPPPATPKHRKRMGFHIALDEVELKLLQEVDTKPMSHAEALLALALTGVKLDYEQGEQIVAAVLIRNTSLFDLSSATSIRVIGENAGGLSASSPYFVRVNLFLDKQLDCPETLRLDINWGRIQFLLMPSCLKSLLLFKDEIQSILNATKPARTEAPKESLFDRFLASSSDFNFVLSSHVDMFECVLSSRDVVEYVEHGEKEPVGAMSLRWRGSLYVSLAFDTLGGSSFPWLSLNVDGKFTDPEDTRLFQDFANRYLSQNSGLLGGSDELGRRLFNAFTARVDLNVQDFQVVRTNICSSQLPPPPKAANLSYKSSHRVCFTVSPPAAGEQRVTNPIDLDAVYRVAGASMADVANSGVREPRVEISQLLTVQARFVDVILYISHSTGGFTESFKATIKPILDVLKKKPTRRKKEDSEGQDLHLDKESERPRKRAPLDLFKSASSMCAMKFEGFRVTCVPGVATRLNESPVVRFEVSQFASGVAAIPVPTDRLTRRRRNSSPNVLAGLHLMHPTIAGWMTCEITGHYHNRRLVAWEPFIEPWKADIRFGVDAVDALKMAPIVTSEMKPAARSKPMFNSGSLKEGTNDRLIDFGRLFRAPFQATLSAKQTANDPLFIPSLVDFCYLMLASTSRTTVLSVLYPMADSGGDKEARVFSRLPAREKLEWLSSFGLPQHATSELYAVSCSISDAGPLNINVTGALLENALGYLASTKKDGFRTVAPHWIRNDTGMTLRFQEVMDADRAKRGEVAEKYTLVNGSEIPVTLTRSLSQTCDPHRAYVHLEFGTLEDTVGRIKHEDFDVPKGSLSTSFFFRTAAKIPVDTVGVHRYPLDWNSEARPDGKSSDSRALGWIIVRVALRDGIKVVSVESPFVLKSTADTNLVCEVREYNGLSLLWRCLVPKADEDKSATKQGLVAVPADIVPFLHHESYTFSVIALPRESSIVHEAELPSDHGSKAIGVSTPAPFSPQSFGKGLIGEEEHTFPTMDPDDLDDTSDNVHLTLCSVRIGSFSGVKAAAEVPEQRMIFFRSPLVVKNSLALPIAVQVRVKSQAAADRTTSVGRRDKVLNRLYTSLAEWEDLGVLQCGQSVNWTGALSTDRVHLRVRFVGTDGDNSRRFPGWSSAIQIPTRDQKRRIVRPGGLNESVTQMRVVDADNVPLYLSVALDGINTTSWDEPAVGENVRFLSETFSPGTRVVSIFVPYWIVDSTNQDLEFFSGAPIAGQLDRRVQSNQRGIEQKDKGATLGLAELLDNENFMHQPSTRSFDVMMVGDESSTRLTARKRQARNSRDGARRHTSPWSDPIPLQAEQNSQFDITVLAPKDATDDKPEESGNFQGFDRFVLRSVVVTAPERFGGLHGTKLIHVVNRYSILNETGRDLEIAMNFDHGSSISVRATSWPQPFHFDDSKPLRFRFKEFGWTWSGRFNIRLNRRQVTMRLRHKMKSQTVIVTVEILEKKKASTTVLLFRQSGHPPFRLENHTMYPMHFGQPSTRMGSDDSEVDAMLLPYQGADFAWDEPELRRRVLVVKAMDSTEAPEGFTLGRFPLDKIAPGTILKLEGSLFAGEVVADGPTRVVRITDAAMPRLSSLRQEDLTDFQQRLEPSQLLTMSLLVRLSHGIGVSVVDWSPQELLYARFDDIHIERKTDQKKDAVSILIGNIKLNNQLWVTPYPVLLKMGRGSDSIQQARRRNRRHDAVSLSWRRSLDTLGSRGNLTLLERLELSSEPIAVHVDGKLANLLIRMIRQTVRIGSNSVQMLAPQSRDDELRKVLELVGENVAFDVDLARKALVGVEPTSDGEVMTTAAVAAKLRAHPLPLVKVQASPRGSRSGSRRARTEPLSNPKPKVYIEKIRISATKADLSWSGPLPGRVSSMLLRALTFERLPLRLRPYSSSHAYGNVKDHVQSLKSHYVSIWRILDLVLGLSYNPTVLFRAVVYTSREACASLLDSWAAEARMIAKALKRVATKEPEVQPTYDDGSPGDDSTPQPIRLRQALLTPFAGGASFMFTASSVVTTWMSSLLKYGSQGGKQLAARGLVRSRNPRLFAHVEGQDLLVEYVEGENAGKALLSRVRMGVHLGEGYIFHAENARLLKARAKTHFDLDPLPLIVMITSERTMLLNGKLDGDFCSVVWEAMFMNIVELEMVSGDSLSLTNSYDKVIIWYLGDSGRKAGNSEEMTAKYARAVVAGLDVLHSMTVYVPQDSGAPLVSRMSNVDKRLKRN